MASRSRRTSSVSSASVATGPRRFSRAKASAATSERTVAGASTMTRSFTVATALISRAKFGVAADRSTSVEPGAAVVTSPSSPKYKSSSAEPEVVNVTTMSAEATSEAREKPASARRPSTAPMNDGAPT